jgi:hypothetical protein
VNCFHFYLVLGPDHTVNWYETSAEAEQAAYALGTALRLYEVPFYGVNPVVAGVARNSMFLPLKDP